MKIRFRHSLAAGIALALCVFAANDRSSASLASAGAQDPAATIVATAWTAAPRLAPSHASWEALMNASWR